ncbi:hypothetical protein ACVR0O_08375 [Streptococcus caviae]|uniref:hypothetical protein n=1 Tax=Streptococcus sp. 'caviae' TaxID=1915004 RepID=UPI00094BC11E|nr:hypothetical protein [Streptococcus sp. 'caviae']OLN82770.1 hypothetical protein BMI76_07500 [Streptococcus sp. 'caviae']
MEKRTDIWKILGIVFIVLTSVFFILTATMTTVCILSNQEVHRLIERSEYKEDKISDYRKTVRKYKEKEARYSKNAYYRYNGRNYGSDESSDD